MPIFTIIIVVFILCIGIFELLRYRRKRVIDKFLYVNNVLPLNAKTLEQMGITDMLSIKLLVKNELLKIVDGDRYYMDLMRYTQLGYFYRRVFSITMTTAVILLICVLVYLIM